MPSIIAPDNSAPITSRGTMFERFFRWVDDMTTAVNETTVLTGTATPEGVQVASFGRFFVDTAAPTLYFKATGDGNTGWIAL